MSQPASGLDKRQATLQLCIRADSKQNLKPALIFKGHVSTEEKEKYDKKVDVYFQQNSWMDEDTNMKWVQGTLIPGVGQNDQGEKFCLQTTWGFSRVNNFMKYPERRSILQFTCCLKTIQTKSSPSTQAVVA